MPEVPRPHLVLLESAPNECLACHHTLQGAIQVLGFFLSVHPHSVGLGSTALTYRLHFQIAA